jgi:hypothetical protein
MRSTPLIARSAVALALLTVGAAHAVLAQRSDSPGTPICPAGASPAVEKRVYTVVAQSALGWAKRAYTDAERQRILFFADAIRQRFVAPSDLGARPILAESMQRGWGATDSPHSTVGGMLVLIVKSNGRIRDQFWQVMPFSAPFSQAVRAAVVAADTSKDFEGIPGHVNTRGDDTLVVQLRALRGDASAGELPLMRAELSSYDIQSLPSVTKPGQLYYPVNAGDQGVENQGEMQVLVGSNGRAVMQSSQVTRIDYRDFLSTMRRAIEGTEFEPPTSNGCKVPFIWVQRFNFSVIRQGERKD